jgi:hypothetical protein
MEFNKIKTKKEISEIGASFWYWWKAFDEWDFIKVNYIC